MNDRIRILFLAANPKDVQHRLDLEGEAREISDKLRRHRDVLEFASEWSVQLETIQEILLTYEPHVLHFSGHGREGGSLAFVDRAGNTVLLDPSVFARLLKILKDNLRLVILNACYTKDQAQFLKETVDFTIGMNRPIRDDTAKVFAAFFYQALASGRSVQAAFDLGCVQLDMGKIPGVDTPELLVRSGADATQPFLPSVVSQEGGARENKDETPPLTPGYVSTMKFVDTNVGETTITGIAVNNYDAPKKKESRKRRPEDGGSAR